MDLGKVSKGYVFPDDASADVASAIMDAADAAVEEFADAAVEELEVDIPPITEFDAVDDPQGGGTITYRGSGPVPGLSHTYIQQNEQYITAHITNKT